MGYCYPPFLVWHFWGQQLNAGPEIGGSNNIPFLIQLIYIKLNERKTCNTFLRDVFYALYINSIALIFRANIFLANREIVRCQEFGRERRKSPSL